MVSERKESRQRKAPPWSALAVVATIVVAFCGYAETYINNVRIEQRRAEINYVNDQLEHLYGPLLSLNESGRRTWQPFNKKYAKDPSLFDTSKSPGNGEMSPWVIWMRQVFMPNNLRMEEVIIKNAHLIEGKDMPKPFVDFLVHVQGYKVVLRQWDDGDYSELLSFNSFPSELNTYVDQTFKMLKSRQQALLNEL